MHRGKSLQWEKPNWRPLVDAVGEVVAGHFMWMHEIELTDGTTLQAYKHIDTRRYVHLAPDGTAFVYEPEDRYRAIPVGDAFVAVFASLPGLMGVTGEQVEASWAAVERLEHRA